MDARKVYFGVTEKGLDGERYNLEFMSSMNFEIAAKARSECAKMRKDLDEITKTIHKLRNLKEQMIHVTCIDCGLRVDPVFYCKNCKKELSLKFK